LFFIHFSILYVNMYAYKRVSRDPRKNFCKQVEHVKLSKKVLCYFEKFAIVNELLIIKYRRISAHDRLRGTRGVVYKWYIAELPTVRRRPVSRGRTHVWLRGFSFFAARANTVFCRENQLKYDKRISQKESILQNNVS